MTAGVSEMPSGGKAEGNAAVDGSGIEASIDFGAAMFGEWPADGGKTWLQVCVEECASDQ